MGWNPFDCAYKVFLFNLAHQKNLPNPVFFTVPKIEFDRFLNIGGSVKNHHETLAYFDWCLRRFWNFRFKSTHEGSGKFSLTYLLVQFPRQDSGQIQNHPPYLWLDAEVWTVWYSRGAVDYDTHIFVFSLFHSYRFRDKHLSKFKTPLLIFTFMRRFGELEMVAERAI